MTPKRNSVIISSLLDGVIAVGFIPAQFQHASQTVGRIIDETPIAYGTASQALLLLMNRYQRTPRSFCKTPPTTFERTKTGDLRS